MRWIWSSRVASLFLTITALSGCATSKDELLPHRQATMLDVWTQHVGAGLQRPAQQLLDARQALRRPLTGLDAEPALAGDSYTRSAQLEIENLFRRLPNPDLVMYVFPHLSGSEQIPIPGYSTVFPMHDRVHYAMPGERMEDY